MSVSLESINLGYILRQITQSNFTMDDFNGRLRLQKIIYLLQVYGIYLGYNFQWYIRGPYCTKLAQHGYELTETYNRIDGPGIKFLNSDIQKKFENARKFFNELEQMDDNIEFTDKIEIAASIHLLQNNTPDMKRDEIINKVTHKQKEFSTDICNKIWNLMEKKKLLDDNNDDTKTYMVSPAETKEELIKKMNSLKNFHDLMVLQTVLDAKEETHDIETIKKIKTYRHNESYSIAMLSPEKNKEKLLAQAILESI